MAKLAQKSSTRVVRRSIPATGVAPTGDPESVTVLLVENETMVREFVRKLLRMEGYHILEAANAAEAIRQCERYQGPIQLLLTDVEMPRMNGRELADLLTKSRQEMKVLFMSGCAGDEILREAILNKVVAFIQKPFAPDAMRQMVRELVEVGSAASAGRTKPATRRASA